MCRLQPVLARFVRVEWICGFWSHFCYASFQCHDCWPEILVLVSILSICQQRWLTPYHTRRRAILLQAGFNSLRTDLGLSRAEACIIVPLIHLFLFEVVSIEPSAKSAWILLSFDVNVSSLTILIYFSGHLAQAFSFTYRFDAGDFYVYHKGGNRTMIHFRLRK